MIRIIASIRLYKDGRRTPFYSGYRPLFDFIEETKTSGQITLLDREAFYPGDEGVVVHNLLFADCVSALY